MDSIDLKPAPVSPPVTEVADLAAACATLGLPAPPDGASSIEVEFLPGCILTISEVTGPPTPFTYVCVADLVAARQHITHTFAVTYDGLDSVDPESYRLRGCLLSGGGMVIDAVQCPVAADAGVPCDMNCRPSRSFL